MRSISSGGRPDCASLAFSGRTTTRSARFSTASKEATRGDVYLTFFRGQPASKEQQLAAAEIRWILGSPPCPDLTTMERENKECMEELEIGKLMRRIDVIARRPGLGQTNCEPTSSNNDERRSRSSRRSGSAVANDRFCTASNRPICQAAA